MNRWQLAITAVIIVVIFIRLFFLWNHQGLWGVDGGAYLLSMYDVLGQEPTNTDFPRPPLAPGWLLVPFVSVFGISWGIKAWAFLISLAILPPFLLLAREFLSPWQRVAAVFLLLFDWMMAEMFTAGVLPMLGFTFILLTMWSVWKLSKKRSLSYTFLIILSIPTIAYTNQSASGIALIILPLFTCSLAFWSKTFRTLLNRLTTPVLIGVGLAATALPFYTSSSPGSDYLRYPGPLVTHYTWDNFSVWVQLFLGLGLGIWALRQQNTLVRSFGAVILVLAGLGTLYSFDESLMNIFYRSRYFLMAFLALAGPYLVGRWLTQRKTDMMVLAYGYIMIGAIALFGGYLFQLHAETKLGRMVTAETVQALEWLQDQEPNGAILTNSYSLSLYVAALTHHPSPWSQVFDPPKAYREQHARVVCVFGWIKDCDVQEAIKGLKAEYVLVETVWPSYDKQVGEQIQGLGTIYRTLENMSLYQLRYKDIGAIWDLPSTEPWGITAEAPWLELVWEKGTTKLWKVRNGVS